MTPKTNLILFAATLSLACRRPPPFTGCPPEMAAIPVGGCIDRYEASVGTGDVGSADGHNTTLVPASVAGKMPVADVTLAQATKACRNAFKHLCEEREWLSSCKNTTNWNHAGSPPMRYPYGTKYDPKKCNGWESSNGGRKGAALTGSFPGCVNQAGVYDLSDNVAEWMATPEETGGYVLRGGSYFNTINDSSCEEDDNVFGATKHSPMGGFRCCLVAEDRKSWW